LSPGSELSKPLDSSEPDYAEILKTPTQKSHRFDLVINRRVNDECGVESDDGLPVIDQPLTGLLTSLQVLCSTCQSQRVLAKIPNQVIQCRNCRNPGLITEGSKFEVPETPDAGSQNMTLAMPTRQQKDTLGITSPPIPSVESMSPWFQSNLVTSKPKVKQKVSDFVKPKKFSIGLTQNLLESNKCDENDQDVDLLEQMPIRKDNSSNDFASPTLDAAAQVTKTHSVKKKKILAAPQADIAPLSTRTQGSPSIDDNLRHISNPARTEWPIASIERDLVITSKTSNGSLGTRTWLERDAMHLKTLSDKRYTTRELAVIALSAADDSGLTAQEIIDWVAQTFTYLEKGTGSWEKNNQEQDLRHS